MHIANTAYRGDNIMQTIALSLIIISIIGMFGALFYEYKEFHRLANSIKIVKKEHVKKDGTERYQQYQRVNRDRNDR